MGLLLDIITTWHYRSQQRAALAALDERQLRDIGLSRADTDLEARRWFWAPWRLHRTACGEPVHEMEKTSYKKPRLRSSPSTLGGRPRNAM